MFTLLYMVPVIIGTVYSFTDWNRFSDAVSFVGLKNYIKVFTSGSKYVSYINNTILFTLWSSALKLGLGLTLALLFTTGMKFTNLHRTIAFAPQVFSMLIIGITFRALLHPSNGFLNIFLKTIGLAAITHDWLGEISTAFGSIIAVDIWKGAGYAMVIFIAGIQNISREYYEAAGIDGAGFFNKLFSITLPCLMQTLTVNLILSITYGLRVFDVIYVLTNGGPGDATDVINTATFINFSKGNYAMGTTLSSILAVITIILSFFILKAMNKEVEY